MGTDQDYRRYIRMVYRVCLGILRDPSEAEDAAHDTFVRYLGGRFRGDARVSTYLYTIATRVCLDQLRKLRRDQRFKARWLDAQEVAGLPTTAHDRLVLAAQLLDDETMDPDDVHMAVCYYVHGMTEQDIANTTGFKRRTVGYRIARFRDRARQRLKESS